jgi:hypothetical protein
VKICNQFLAKCLLAIAAAFLCTVPSRAQATTASIHGTVTDPTGALLSNATVTVVNTSTGIVNTQTTDSKGYFLFPNLHIGGPYMVTMGARGFQKFVETGIMLDLSSARAIDAKLQIGTSSQTIQVNSTTAQVETSDVQLKNVVGATELEELPTLGRDAVQLQKTAPGVVESNDREGTFSTNGSQTQENDYLLDGTDINDILLNQPGITVNPDALAEVNIISSTLDPEFSRNSGAIVDEALKSGTNQFQRQLLLSDQAGLSPERFWRHAWRTDPSTPCILFCRLSGAKKSYGANTAHTCVQQRSEKWKLRRRRSLI